MKSTHPHVLSCNVGVGLLKFRERRDSRALDESEMPGWRKFRADPVLGGRIEIELDMDGEAFSAEELTAGRARMNRRGEEEVRRSASEEEKDTC